MTLMLRRIQIFASCTAAFFGVVALGDVFAMQAGKFQGVLPGASLWSWSNLHLAPALTDMALMTLAIGLAIAPFIGAFSVARSSRWCRVGNVTRLDAWRRLTWGASIIETTGCLLLVMNGIVLFVPSAVALLIAGVAELASIMYDMERQPEHAVRRLAHHHHLH